MLTLQQLATLRAEIDADPVLAAKPMNGDGHFDIAVILNTELAAPDFFVWKSSVPVNEIMGNSFDWTRVDNMTVGESRIWEYMTQLGAIDASKANIRAGVNEAYKGTAQDDAMRLAIFGHCQKRATRGQKLFASGAGTTTTNAGVGPAVMVVETILAGDVQQARELP